MNEPPPRSDHVRDRHVRQPQVAADVGTHDAFVHLVRHTGRRPEIRIHPGILHHDVDPAAPRDRLVHQVLQLLLARDMARDDDRLAAPVADAGGHRLARIRLAAGDHDRRAMLRHPRGDRRGRFPWWNRSRSRPCRSGRTATTFWFPPLRLPRGTERLGVTPRGLPALPMSMLPASETSIRRQQCRHSAPAFTAGNNSHRLLHPQSIAVIGASTRAGSFGERVLLNLQHYAGRTYPVNARYQTIGDQTCYPTVARSAGGAGLRGDHRRARGGRGDRAGLRQGRRRRRDHLRLGLCGDRPRKTASRSRTGWRPSRARPACASSDRTASAW